MAEESATKISRKRMLVRGKDVLKHLAQYDSELAEELLQAPEDVEDVIAERLSLWHKTRKMKMANIDIETLMVCFEFYNDLMKIALGFFVNANVMFMQQFMSSYAYIAQAVAEAQKGQKAQTLENKICEVVDKVMNNITSIQKMMLKTGGVNVE